jgi:hypothetical protein
MNTDNNSTEVNGTDLRFECPYCGSELPIENNQECCGEVGHGTWTLGGVELALEFNGQRVHMSSDAINGCLDNDPRIQFTTIESFGKTLEELVNNCTVGREDWNGNTLKAVSVGEVGRYYYDVLDELKKFALSQSEAE